MSHKVEELVSKAFGVMKGAKASVEGLGGVFRHLVQEHGEASALLMRLKLTSDTKVREEIWRMVRRELLLHEEAEMRVVYPALRESEETRAMSLEHDRDAQDMQQAIAELDEIGTSSPQWQPALERLIQMVQEHVRDEEEEYFPIADRVFADSSELLKRFEEARTAAARQLDAS